MIPPKSSLKRTAAPQRKTWLKKSTKPIPNVNARRQAKRKAGYRKLLAGKEYKAARAEAMARSGNRCELWLSWTDHAYYGNAPPVPFALTATVNATTTHVQRCANTEDLHAHHRSYPKSRPLQASDLIICCKYHHEYLESQKLGKRRMVS